MTWLCRSVFLQIVVETDYKCIHKFHSRLCFGVFMRSLLPEPHTTDLQLRDGEPHSLPELRPRQPHEGWHECKCLANLSLPSPSIPVEPVQCCGAISGVTLYRRFGRFNGLICCLILEFFCKDFVSVAACYFGVVQWSRTRIFCSVSSVPFCFIACHPVFW